MKKVNEKEMYNYFMEVIKNTIGVCALMGNLQCESALYSDNLQNVFNKKTGLSDEEYTSLVDTGEYNKNKFIHDGYGYGLAQLTFYSRKENLYNYAKEKGCSISDYKMQMDFIILELNYYRCNGMNFISYLKQTTDINKSTVDIMKIYEAPYDISNEAQNARKYASKLFYEKLVLLKKNEEIKNYTHYIQFGAFISKDNAENYKNLLKDKYGIDISIKYIKPWYKVIVTGFNGYGNARKFIEEHKLQDCIIKEL